MENNKKKVKIFPSILIALSVMLVFAIILLFVWYLSSRTNKGSAEIELSTSIDKIYLGGSGKISATLRYENGDIFNDCDFVYESDNPDLLTFTQSDGKYTGGYTIEPKRSDEFFSDVNVVVTVSCVDYPDIEPSSIQLTITDAKPLSIKFYINREDTESTQIEIYQGYSIAQINEIQQISLSIPDYRPSNDFGTEWYDKETNALVAINKDTVFYGYSELKLYGRYRLNKSLTLVDELNGPDNLQEFQTQLYFGELINDEALLQALREGLDSTNGWLFDGWVPDINDSTSENSFKAGLAEGKFVSANSTLYAKWTTNLNLHTTFDLRNTIDTTIQVTYNAIIPELPKPIYRNGGVFQGWYSEQYGIGDDPIEPGDKYTRAANLDIYDKVQFTITLNYQDETSKNGGEETRDVIYGWSLDDIGYVLPSPTKETWTFNDWYDSIDEAGKKIIEAEPYEYESNITIYARWTSTFKLYRELDTEGDADPTQIEIIDVTYNQALSLPEESSLIAGEWLFEGYYNGIGGTEGQVVSTEKYLGEGSKNLYAKWTSSINFEVPLAEGATESLGAPKIANATINSIPVTYRGSINELPDIEFAYPNGLTNVGWYTDKYGAGSSLTSFLQDGCYIGAANQTYYNKTEIEIVFHDDLTGSSVSRTVVYGASFTDAFPRFTKTGWALETNWDVTGIGEVTEDFMRTFRYNLNKTTTCNAIWNITIQYNADIGKIVGVYSEDEVYYTVRYGQTLDLDQPTNQGSWRFSGWYDNEDLSGETVERQSTSSSAFIDFASKHITQINGKFYLRLYAKWINEVSLDYGYDRDQSRPSGLPTTLHLVYGKTVSSSASGQTLPSRREVSGSSNEYIPNGYAMGLGWYTDKNIANDDTFVDGTTHDYPLSMSVLYFQWQGATYQITLKYNDITGQEFEAGVVEEVQYGKPMPPLDDSYKPTGNLSGNFLGYFYNGKQYYKSDLTSARNWDQAEKDVDLYAKFGTEYTITLDFNGGSGGTGSVRSAYNEFLPSAIAPTRIGYNFTGYYEKKDDPTSTRYYDKEMNGVVAWDKTGDTRLYAGWDPIKLNEITTSKNNNDDLLGIGSSEAIYIHISGGSGWYYYKCEFYSGTSDAVWWEWETKAESTSTQVVKNKLTVHRNKDNVSAKLLVTVIDAYNGLSKTKKLDVSTSCFAEGTRILMADGSYKNIEDIKVGDIVMSWNFVAGQLEAMPVALYWYHGTSVHTVLNLEFSDKTTLRIIGSHGLFDYDLNKYVYLTADNYKDYIGHSFVVYDAVQGYTRITLTSAYVTSEEVGSYSLRTACNDNAFAEGLLTLTAEDFPGYLTYFEVGENMKYDQEKMQADIEMYGLFTYEDWLNDWSEYITYEEFIAFSGQYFKILIGKGILSYEDIFTLIDGLRNGLDIQS